MWITVIVRFIGAFYARAAGANPSAFNVCESPAIDFLLLPSVIKK
jgi:hypothetical protein